MFACFAEDISFWCMVFCQKWCTAVETRLTEGLKDLGGFKTRCSHPQYYQYSSYPHCCFQLLILGWISIGAYIKYINIVLLFLLLLGNDVNIVLDVAPMARRPKMRRRVMPSCRWTGRQKSRKQRGIPSCIEIKHPYFSTWTTHYVVLNVNTSTSTWTSTPKDHSKGPFLGRWFLRIDFWLKSPRAWCELPE